jgi:hypothetical protein
MMKKLSYLILISLLAMPALATITVDKVNFTSDPSVATHYETSWDSVNSALSLAVGFTEEETDLVSLDVTGMGSFSTFYQAVNINSRSWIGYEIEILNASGVEFVDGTFSTDPSNIFQNVSLSTDGKKLTYMANDQLLVGQAVLLLYDLDVTEPTSTINFAYTPIPVPEPATLALLGMGIVGMLKRRRA